MDFWHHNMSLKSLRNGLLTPQYESIWVFWHHNMSQYESQITQKWTFDTTIWVASPIYALLSVIRQQMSPFDPFRGGGRQKGTMSPFFTVFFFRRASLRTNYPNTSTVPPSIWSCYPIRAVLCCIVNDIVQVIFGDTCNRCKYNVCLYICRLA